MNTFKSLIRTIALPCVFAAGALHAPAVLAHGGEDHGDGAPAVRTAQLLAPRAEAKSDEVEMLAVYDKRELTLFLSAYRTNEPLTGLDVEIESGANKAVATMTADGVYRIAAPWLASPGKHGLVVTLQGNELADLLETTLDVPVPVPAAVAEDTGVGRFAPAGLIGSLGGAALFGWAAFSLIRRKK